MRQATRPGLYRTVVMATHAVAAGGAFDQWSVVNHRLAKAGYATVNVQASASTSAVGGGRLLLCRAILPAPLNSLVALLV